MMRKIIAMAALAAMAACTQDAQGIQGADQTLGTTVQTTNPKREFRGAWMHTVFQEQYARQNTAQNQEYLRRQLDLLKDAGVNAVLFQVRPSADAFYASNLEPWSRFLTTGGQPPVPYWDPLEFMCDEAHKRGMELHAWINPYRVTTSRNEQLPPNHIYHQHPERFVLYEGDGKLYFDPGLPENREFITEVVLDIVNRYDVDAIHMDDYFYPYPAAGKDFGDDASYALYGNGADRGDWRRQNVDILIQGIHQALRTSQKPWVRFGVSPFGIWRNISSDPRGSQTNGLENYDDLYADPLLWAQEGWIDYLIPQLYWELDHPRASYRVLVDWWNTAVHGLCHLYIGQDVEKCMSVADTDAPDQLDRKIRMTRDAANIHGNCWWPAYSLTSDVRLSATRLKSGAQSTPALVPEYSNISAQLPDPVTGLGIYDNNLSWNAGMLRNQTSDQVRFVVYRFPTVADINLHNAAYILAITPETSIEVPAGGVYVVTALDRVNNESRPSEYIVNE